MLSRRRTARAASALIAAAAVTLLVSGCAFYKQGSLTLAQPEGIGKVRVHFILCSLEGVSTCGKDMETSTVQYLLGIAVPPGATPPQTITATSTKGGAPIVFTRNEEVAPEIAAGSAAMQKTLSEATPKEREEAEAFKPIIGGPWPPAGLQGVGYLSPPVQETEGQAVEWSVDADFGLPAGQPGHPFAGPFGTGIAVGLRLIEAGQPASRPVHCVRFTPGFEANKTESFCSGSIAEALLGSADLAIAPPAKPAQAFVGGSTQLSYGLQFAGGGTPPSFTLKATSTAKGAKTKLSPGSFTPGAPDPTTHLSPAGTGKVTVSVPRSLKPGAYKVTLTATAPQGGSVSGEAAFKVVKAKIKILGVKPANGRATLQVKVPGAGKLKIAGKGIKTTTRKSKKAQKLKLAIVPTGAAAARLLSGGSVRLKAKATFKPSSGISVSKTKTIVLKGH
jgi:hypothetical protein